MPDSGGGARERRSACLAGQAGLLPSHSIRVTPSESLHPSHFIRVTPSESLYPSHSYSDMQTRHRSRAAGRHRRSVGPRPPPPREPPRYTPAALSESQHPSRSDPNLNLSESQPIRVSTYPSRNLRVSTYPSRNLSASFLSIRVASSESADTGAVAHVLDAGLGDAAGGPAGGGDAHDGGAEAAAREVEARGAAAPRSEDLRPRQRHGGRLRGAAPRREEAGGAWAEAEGDSDGKAGAEDDAE